jgi:hypothetical protein
LAQRAGVLWDDADFQTCKFGEYCEGDIVPLPKKPLRILHAWNEKWERTQFKSSGDDVFGAAFSQKYGGLMFRDLDRDGQVGWTMAENCAVLQRCYKDRKRRTEIKSVTGYGWYFALLVCYDGYHTEQFYHQQSSSDCYELFELMNSTDFYDMMVEYYEGNEVMQRWTRRGSVMRLMPRIELCLLRDCWRVKWLVKRRRRVIVIVIPRGASLREAFSPLGFFNACLNLSRYCICSCYFGIKYCCSACLVAFITVVMLVLHLRVDRR